MKIAIVSQYFPPEPVLIPEQLAQGLRSRGHDVRVITAFPNYPQGRLYPDFRQRMKFTEDYAGISVRRVPIFVSHSQNPFARVVNYTSFALSSLTAGAFVRRADVVYVYATQMTAAIAPSMWRRNRGIPFVLHVQDLWPESIAASSLTTSRAVGRLISGILTPWLRRTYRRASATIGISDSMKDLLVGRGAPADKTFAVYNWGNEVAERTVDIPAAKRGGLTVVYAGNVGDLQDLETAIHAATACRDLVDFTLRIVGDGVAKERLVRLADDLDASNVEFRPRVEAEELEAIYDESDFQLVSLKDIPIFNATVPSKFQGSIARGVPVITAVGGDLQRIVAGHQVGFASPPSDAAKLAAAFREAHGSTAAERRAMGERAVQLYDTQMSMARGVDRIEKILIDAADNGRKTRNP